MLQKYNQFDITIFDDDVIEQSNFIENLLQPIKELNDFADQQQDLKQEFQSFMDKAYKFSLVVLKYCKISDQKGFYKNKTQRWWNRYFLLKNIIALVVYLSSTLAWAIDKVFGLKKSARTENKFEFVEFKAHFQTMKESLEPNFIQIQEQYCYIKRIVTTNNNKIEQAELKINGFILIQKQLLQKKVNEKTEQIHQKESCESQLIQLEQDSNRLKIQVDEQQAQIKNEFSKSQQLQIQKNNLEKNIKNENNELSKMQTQKDNLEQQKEQSQTQQLWTKNKISQVEGKIFKKEDQIIQRNVDIDEANKNIQELHNKIEEMRENNTNKNLNTIKTGLVGGGLGLLLAPFTAGLSLAAGYAFLQGSVGVAIVNDIGYKKVVKEHNQFIDQLQKEISQYQDDIQSYSIEKQEYQQQFDDCQNYLEDLMQQERDLKQEIELKQISINKHEKQISSLHSEIQQSNSTIKKIEQAIDDNRKQIVQHNSRLGKLTIKAKNHTDSLQKTEAEIKRLDNKIFQVKKLKINQESQKFLSQLYKYFNDQFSISQDINTSFEGFHQQLNQIYRAIENNQKLSEKRQLAALKIVTQKYLDLFKEKNSEIQNLCSQLGEMFNLKLLSDK